MYLLYAEDPLIHASGVMNLYFQSKGKTTGIVIFRGQALLLRLNLLSSYLHNFCEFFFNGIMHFKFDR